MTGFQELEDLEKEIKELEARIIRLEINAEVLLAKIDLMISGRMPRSPTSRFDDADTSAGDPHRGKTRTT